MRQHLGTLPHQPRCGAISSTSTSCRRAVAARALAPTANSSRRLTVVARARPAPETSSNKQKPGMSRQAPHQGLDRSRSFLLAQERLETLLTDAALTNKDVVLADHLDAMSPEERLTLVTNLGTLVLLAEVLCCWLFGEGDPLGGMDFTAASLHAAITGVACAAPLLVCSLVARSQAFRRRFPVLEQLHVQQAELQRHFTAGMNVPQMGIWLSFVAVPSLLTLLPATRAGVLWAASFTQSALLTTWGSGVHLPRFGWLPGLAALAAPLLSSYMAGNACARWFSVRPKQMEMLRDALKQADAYFRIAAARQPGMGPDDGSNSSSGGGAVASPRPVRVTGPPSVFASSSSLNLGLQHDEAWEEEEEEAADSGEVYTGGQAAADAFKTLTMVWLVSRRQVAQLGSTLAALNMLYYSILWAATGDMTTPTVAALLHAGLEVALGEQSAAEMQRRRG